MRWLPLLVLATLAAAEPRLEPPFQRIDLEPAASAEILFHLRADPGTTATACVVDCACLRALTTLPAAVDPQGSLAIRFRASGIRPGVESIVIATTAGSARANLQIAGPGTGTGLDVLRGAIAKAQAERLALWGIAHNLRGQIRNCGCSAGALGGIGYLAALPAQVARLAPGLATRWVLTGNVDGPRQGVGDALRERGWLVGDSAIQVTGDPASLFATPGIVAVIPTVPIAIQHRRIVHPVLDRGLSVDLLLVDGRGLIVEHRALPVDQTLADDPTLAARFPDRLTATIVPTSTPSVACATCHPTAAKAWSASPHAQAWARLPEADRTDSCVGCHSTPIGAGKLAPAVHCQACHQGGDAHGDSLGATRTTGTRDCRSCHDAQHHPAFLREKAWATILHGCEPAKR